jgi:ABC-2 type transport system permease protein
VRELGRVVANEWMKLMRRRRLWIAVLLAGLAVCAWSAHSYKNYLHLVEWDLPEKLQLRIEQAEQELKTWEKELKNPDSSREGEDPEEQIAGAKQEIADLKQRLKEEQRLASDDWQPVVRDWIAQTERQMKEAAKIGDKAGEAMAQGRLMELKYHLENGVPPTPRWKKTAFQEMDDLIHLISRVFLPMLVVILVADIVSGETTAGTIRLLLIRPVSRAKILFGKWLVSVLATVLLTFIIFALMFGVNAALYGMDGWDQPKIVNVAYTFEKVDSPDSSAEPHTVSIPHYDRAAIVPMFAYILSGGLFLALAMIAVATLVFLCSVLFRYSMISTAVAFAMIILGEILYQTVNSGKIFWLYTVHLNLLNNWTGRLAAELQADLSLFTGWIVLGCWTLLAMIPAFLTFTRRDVLNH